MQMEKRRSNESMSSSSRVICVKLHCVKQAFASLIFNPRRAEAWLVDKPQATEDSISMCPDHAKAFKAPMGWVFTDERTAEDEADVAVEAIEEALDEGERADEPVLASVELLYPEENDAAVDESESFIVASESDPEHPEIDRTPLLARAFRNSQSLLNE